MTDVTIIKCPDCEFPMDLDGGEIGDYIECDTCACEMIIKSISPPRLKVLEEEK